MGKEGDGPDTALQKQEWARFVPIRRRTHKGDSADSCPYILVMQDAGCAQEQARPSR
jgi:hypothetical protein